MLVITQGYSTGSDHKLITQGYSVSALVLDPARVHTTIVQDYVVHSGIRDVLATSSLYESLPRSTVEDQ